MSCEHWIDVFIETKRSDDDIISSPRDLEQQLGGGRCIWRAVFIEGVLSRTAVVSPHPLSFTEIILSRSSYAPPPY